MIKNLLYSLFLHSLILAIIYANFKLKHISENKTSEIAVSLVALKGNDGAVTNKTNESTAIKKDETLNKNKELEKPKSKQKSPRNKVKKQPKKLAQSKPEKSLNKIVEEEKIQEFKEKEKVEEKQEEAAKTKEDKIVNDNQDNEQRESLNKEKDLGSKQQFKDENEADDQKDTNNNNYAEMANSLENIALSAREKFNIHSQLKRCYRHALDESKLVSKIKVMVKVSISEDGYIDSNIDDMIDKERYSKPNSAYKIAIDNVRRALDLCSPLRNLPLDKYEVWKEVVLEFDDEKVKAENPENKAEIIEQ